MYWMPLVRVRPALALALLLLFTACGGTNATAPARSTPRTQLSTYADTGPRGLPFYDPQGLCFDPQGNLYVADGSDDAGHYRLIKVSPDRQVLAEWHYFRHTFHGDANGPIGIACGRDAVYVADASENRILKFRPTGSLLAIWGGPDHFKGIDVLALDSEGNLYVAQYASSRVEKYTPTGRLLTTITVPQLNASDEQPGPIGIVVDAQGTIYISDQPNNRVLHLSPTGAVLQSWGKQGGHPGGLAFDSKGNLYVGDDDNYRIQKFSPQGKFLSQWKMPPKDAISTNTGPGPLTETGDLIYTSDTDASGTWHVLGFSTEGKIVHTF